jgi:hypothetical protein
MLLQVVELLELIAAHHNSGKLPLQLVACSATVGMLPYADVC